MATEKESPKEAAPAAAAASAGNGGWLPVIVVLVLVPAISFALAEFVLFPRLEKRLAAAAGGGGDAAAHGGGSGGSHGKPAAGGHESGKKAEASFSHEFKDIVSNLAGSMRSRYIKVSFTAYSSNAELEKIVEENRAKLLDATLTVLSALSLADTEDPTIKPKVKGQLVQAYEAILHERVIEEIYFSEFVIQ